jgi:biotin carboxylase
MKRLLLTAATTGYQTRAFVAAAERAGYELSLATDRCHILEDPWGDRAIPVRFDEPEASAELIAAAARETPVLGIVAVGDRPTLLAAVAAERLGLAHNPPAAVLASRDKYLARRLFKAAGMRVPWFFRAPAESDPAPLARRAEYPCVLKPLGLSGSRGVIRAGDEAEFTAAFARIRGILESASVRILKEEQNRYIQVEGFIPGREFAIEGLLTGGQLRVIAIFDKPDPLDGPHFEETIYVTPSRAPGKVQSDLIETTARAARALGLVRGPIHAEARWNQDGAWILEVAARPIGGLCARVLRFGTDTPYEEIILRHAAGEEFGDLAPRHPAAGAMMIPIPGGGVFEGAEGEERALQVPGIDELVITAIPGQRLIPLPEGASYLGFLFASGADSGAVEQSLRLAHAELRFRIAAELPVLC